jgi:hypothetical protein
MSHDLPDEDLPEGVIRFPRRVVVRPTAPQKTASTSQSARLVYDVRRWNLGYAVTFQGAPLTQHASLDAAIANARLIASNFWAMGKPTLVRVVNDDQSISPVISFG